MNLFQRGIIAAILGYQRRGGGRERFRVECNFEPSCSEYGRQAVERFGVLRGLGLSLKRLRRCREPDLPEKIDDPLPSPSGESPC